MRKPNLELKRAIDGMISEGHTINEISEMLSLPLFTVETIANKIAEEKEKVAKRKQEREQKVMTLVSEGKTYKEIISPQPGLSSSRAGDIDAVAMQRPLSSKR